MPELITDTATLLSAKASVKAKKEQTHYRAASRVGSKYGVSKSPSPSPHDAQGSEADTRGSRNRGHPVPLVDELGNERVPPSSAADAVRMWPASPGHVPLTGQLTAAAHLEATNETLVPLLLLLIFCTN
jgi:hypothetical protein